MPQDELENLEQNENNGEGSVITTTVSDGAAKEKINISISNLIAKNTNHSSIVRFNSNYRAIFDFDLNSGSNILTWGAADKQAKFVWTASNGEEETAVKDILFDEDTEEYYCDIPIVENGAECMLIGAIGTSTENGEERNLYTTTSAFVMCVQSIHEIGSPALGSTDNGASTIDIDDTENLGVRITNDGYLILNCNQTEPGSGEPGESRPLMTNGEVLTYGAGKVIPKEVNSELDDNNNTLINFVYDLAPWDEDTGNIIRGPGINSITYDDVNHTLTINYADDYSITTGSIIGATPNVQIGSVSTVDYNVGASVWLDSSSTVDTPVFDFSIPRGNTGLTPDIHIGSVTTGAAGSSASVELDSSSTLEVPYFNFTIPRGDRGEIGPVAAFSIGSVEALPTGSASATITGTSAAPVLNLGLPKGDTGSVGPAAGFGSVQAHTVIDGGNPSIEVLTSGPDIAKNMDFYFKNIGGLAPSYSFTVSSGVFTVDTV